ncbi:MAG: hypothetical protein ABSB28_01620 [Candidatus Bathyarchaeia archaeon]
MSEAKHLELCTKVGVEVVGRDKYERENGGKGSKTKKSRVFLKFILKVLQVRYVQFRTILATQYYFISKANHFRGRRFRKEKEGEEK